MKTKNTISICMLLLCMLLSFEMKAQQLKYAQPENAAAQIPKAAPVAYTYKLFQASNKMYGYDIFLSGKIIFHQGAAPIQQDNLISALSKKEQADKAALLAIEKIKQHQPATLTQREIEKITSE